MRTPRPVPLVLTLLALGVLAAPPAVAGGGGGGGPCGGFGEGERVVLRDGCLDPVAQFVEADATLTVVNDGAVPHNLIAVDGRFATKDLQPGETASVQVPAGLHRVYCSLHSAPDGSGMAGVLVAGGDAVLASAAIGQDADAERAVAAGSVWWVAGAALAVALVALAVGVANRRADRFAEAA